MEKKLIGRYEIHAELGRGGMATVYSAYDPRFEREVAIKVLPPALMHDPSFRARFDREAKIIASLEHSAIVPVYDFGEEDGQPYLVMRLMTDGSLADQLHKGCLRVAEAARIVEHIAPALDDAHAKGIIHRDLKPGNILFDQRGDPFLSDFGIAKLTQASTLTSSQAIVGTPAYMSPEQARGEPMDWRSDIYSLGAILFEMLSGRVPYEAESPTGQMIKHITDPIPNLFDIRPDLCYSCQEVINRAMAKNREQRYQTTADMAQALLAASRVNEAPSSQLSTPRLKKYKNSRELKARPARKLPIWIWITGGMVVLALILAGVSIPLRGILTRPSETLTMTVTVTKQPTVMPSLQPTVTSLPSATQTDQPATSTATPSPTATITPTPTDLPRAVVLEGAANVRSGPGMNYPTIQSYTSGTELVVVGRNAAGTWLVVLLPDGATTGWISLTLVTLNVDVNTLPVVQAPPSPTPRLVLPTETKPPHAPQQPPTNTSAPPGVTPYP